MVNTRELIKFWDRHYYNRFGKGYRTQNKKTDFFSLRNVLEKYNKFIIMSSMIYFLNNTPIEKAFISNFASNKYFESRFEKFINLKNVIKYYYIAENFTKENKDKTQELLDEYKIYLEADIVYDFEKVRKQEIIKELKEIEEKECKKT
jgi:hypothetical protein